MARHMIRRTVEWLRRASMWNLLWVSLLLSEILTAAMNALMGYLWWGKISGDLILIGVVDAFFVAGIVTAIMILIFKEFGRLEREAEEQRREIGVLQEREEVSRWLHDDLGSDLFNIILLTEIIQQKGDPGREAVDYLDWITDASRNALNNIRSYLNFSEQVGPAVKDLVGYMRDYGQILFRNKGVDFDFRSDVGDDSPALLPMKSFSVYLIYKEAITNILKHARAKRVQVRLAEQAGRVHLTISDDGRGFRLEESAGDQYGKKNITYRAESIGGEITFETEPDKGTRVCLTVPV